MARPGWLALSWTVRAYAARAVAGRPWSARVLAADGEAGGALTCGCGRTGCCWPAAGSICARRWRAAVRGRLDGQRRSGTARTMETICYRSGVGETLC